MNGDSNDQALSTLEVIIGKYEQDIPLASKAQFLKGVVYERQDMWDQALTEYQTLRDEYTDTSLGIQVPLYLGDTYLNKGKLVQAEGAYNEAAMFYEMMERKNRGKALGYISANFLAKAYLRIKDYEQAGRTIEEIIAHYPSGLTFAQQLANIELVFVKKLQRPAKALELYEYMKEESEDSDLREIIAERINSPLKQ